MSEKPNDDNGNSRKRILDWGNRDKDILNNCLTILTDLLDDTGPGMADSNKNARLDDEAMKNENGSVKTNESGTKADWCQKGANMYARPTNTGLFRPTHSAVPMLANPRFSTTVGANPNATHNQDGLDLYKELFHINYVLDNMQVRVPVSAPQHPVLRTQYVVSDMDENILSAGEGPPGPGHPIRLHGPGKSCRCQVRRRKFPVIPTPITIKVPKENTKVLHATTLRAQDALAPGQGNADPEQGHTQDAPGIYERPSDPENATPGEREKAIVAAENFMKAEHELKMKQMAEAHEWARKEHDLKVQEQELKIEYVKLQKQLVEKQL